jgi:hypothetical protein
VGWFETSLPAFLREEAHAAAAVEATAVEAAEAAVEAEAAEAEAAEAKAAASSEAVASEGERLRAATARLRARFVHIDCDLYSSTKTVLALLAPAIRAGSATLALTVTVTLTVTLT